MTTHKQINLLVDGDITYHRTSHMKNDDGSSYTLDQGIASIDAHYAWLKRHLDADKLTVVLSGPSGANFRKSLYPMYKGDRPTERPVILDQLKNYLMDAYRPELIPNLEADDVLGIMSTEPNDEDRIIVSIDKDLLQIPGKLFNPTKVAEGIQVTNLREADLRFYGQWLTGDATDSYPGVPGVGPKKADKVIAEAFRQYELCGRTAPWRELVEAAIVSTYERYSLDYVYALCQGRLARILRHGDYVDGKVQLWCPIETLI